MNYKIGDILFTRDQISARVVEIAEEISKDFIKENIGQELFVVGILKGSAIFVADLVRALGHDIDVRMDFMVISSYGSDTKSSGVVRIIKDLDTYIENKNVIIVEDIIDTGLTMSYLLSILERRSPASIKVCTLLNKEERRKVPVSIDYCGFNIPDKFVIGYGLDYSGKWRHLPDIRIAEPVRI
ncbi:MAG: hypoxanthine phosphoribosyltransferase [Synergistaceae bacterium]|nr:hypoxanthine phosphoribosyltransferase [Synergistaceae bacterium]